MTRLTSFEAKGLPLINAWTFIREHREQVASGASFVFALLLALVVYLSQEHGWGVWGFILIVATIICALAFQGASWWFKRGRTRYIVPLEKEIQELKADIACREEASRHDAEKRREAISREAHKLLEELELLVTHARITVYQHEPNRSTFIAVSRVSHNPELAHYGRSEYPDNQGLIAEAWKVVRATRTHLPADETEWAEEVSLTGVPWQDALRIKMKSRSYAGIRMDYEGQWVGVMMLESLNPLGVTGTHADGITKLPAFKELCAMLAVTPKLPLQAEPGPPQ